MEYKMDVGKIYLRQFGRKSLPLYFFSEFWIWERCFLYLSLHIIYTSLQIWIMFRVQDESCLTAYKNKDMIGRCASFLIIIIKYVLADWKLRDSSKDVSNQTFQKPGTTLYSKIQCSQCIEHILMEILEEIIRLYKSIMIR